MAAAARLTDPLRTSPTAKIPGRPVSRKSGWRAWAELGPGLESR